MSPFPRKSRMVETSKYGSEGAPGGQPPGATRPHARAHAHGSEQEMLERKEGRG